MTSATLLRDPLWKYGPVSETLRRPDVLKEPFTATRSAGCNGGHRFGPVFTPLIALAARIPGPHPSVMVNGCCARLFGAVGTVSAPELNSDWIFTICAWQAAGEEAALQTRVRSAALMNAWPSIAMESGTPPGAVPRSPSETCSAVGRTPML